MHLALFLVALGFGYKVYVDASLQRSKNLKRLGKLIGIVIMVASFSASLCIASCSVKYMCAKGGCSFMGKGGMGKMMCPITGKTMDGSDMPAKSS